MHRGKHTKGCPPNQRNRLNLMLFGCLMILTAASIITYATGRAGRAEPGRLSETVPMPEEAPMPEETPPLTLEDIRMVSFTDVAGGDSWADCIRYMACQGIMNGAGTGAFEPEVLVDRAAAVAALFHMSGEEAPEYTGAYKDVQAEDWYAGALAWAIQADLLESDWIETGAFGPQEPITRAQLAMMLVRHAGYMAAKTDGAEDGQYGSQMPADTAVQAGVSRQRLAKPGNSGELVDVTPRLEDYKDGDSVPEPYAPYMVEALRHGLFKGMVSDTVYPNLPVNRGQMAQVLTALTAWETREPLAAELAGGLQAETVVSVAAANHDAMQAKVDEIAARYGAVGLQAAVIEDGAVTDSFAYGWATKKTDPMTADHKMRVASLSKVSVGMAAMVLRDQGVIKLDSNIGDYWGFPTKNTYYPDSPVSIRSLLSHTSSIPLYGDDMSRSKSAVESKLRNNCYNNLKPGSVWSWGYNNYAFAVLGMTLELAGKDYLDNILGENLWAVMDIDAAFEGGEIQALDKLVTIYRHDGSVGRSMETQKNYKRPSAPGGSGSSFAGGLTISANDLAKLLGLLANDGSYQGLRLLSKESVALMETRFDQILSDGTYQALPLRSQDNIYGRDRLYYHTGSAYGVYNFMSYDPETGDGIVVLSSGASASKDENGIYAVCGNISKYFYELAANPS